jgi:hypothetical protein
MSFQLSYSENKVTFIRALQKYMLNLFQFSLYFCSLLIENMMFFAFFQAVLHPGADLSY